MKNRAILEKIKNCADELHIRFHVKALYVFGSVARNEHTKNSDIDILVEFDSPSVGIFEFCKLKDFLEKKLKLPVDLVTRDAIKSSLLPQIEKDSIRAA